MLGAMGSVPDKEEHDHDRDDPVAVGFKRHFFLPGVLLTVAEAAAVVLPFFQLFETRGETNTALARIAVPVLAGAVLIWWAAMTSWLSPVQRAILQRRRNKRLPKPLAQAAYAATWKVPLRALLLRTGLWVGAAVAVGIMLHQYAGWTTRQIGELTAVTAMHAFVVNAPRAVWYAVILGRVRTRLFSGITPVRRFADGYFGRLFLVAAVVSGGTLAAVAAFLYYFVPITLEQYLQVQTCFLPALAVGLCGWALLARRLAREINGYLAQQLDGDRGGGAPADAAAASSVYRAAQSLPYRLAVMTTTMWILVAGGAAWLAYARMRFAADDAVLMLGIALVMAVGASIYELLWHRETMRPLLDHLTVRHRLPVRGIRPAMSLRTKLLLSLGGVVLFACGTSLFWGFVQYKSQATDFGSRQAELGLAWLRSEIQARLAESDQPPTAASVRTALQGINASNPEVVYYYLAGDDADVLGRGGGPMGAPRLPWYALAQMHMLGDRPIEVGSLDLAGRFGPLLVGWHGGRFQLGTVAVLFPTYRGRGPSIVRPLKELVVFFLVLFGVCAGIVLITVAQFVGPIRKLEQRADGMARGELAEPVSSGAEGDEIGRLTFALEEMRRALREKLRSTEEVNLDLERAVQRRTADLAKKNRELAETLDKLTRAQDQLVRSEKMASIGQLVAGIAHEINNPVNAIVNTIGPLEEAIGQMESDDQEHRHEAADDIREMVRVVQRGAHRTKDIVRALHNYSRTDDESVVEFDLNRGIDDSLELLRHMVKGNVEVVRNFGNVGRLRAHAGQLNQVFVNLIVNAVQALGGREDATIWIETREQDGRAVISMRDNGPGIPAEVLPRIFDPFFTTKDVGEGSGLGLSIVHGIVERHGGTIEVTSVVGQGTTFTVSLPRDGVEAAPSSRAHA